MTLRSFWLGYCGILAWALFACATCFAKKDPEEAFPVGIQVQRLFLTSGQGPALVGDSLELSIGYGFWRSSYGGAFQLCLGLGPFASSSSKDQPLNFDFESTGIKAFVLLPAQASKLRQSTLSSGMQIGLHGQQFEAKAIQSNVANREIPAVRMGVSLVSLEVGLFLSQGYPLRAEGTSEKDLETRWEGWTVNLSLGLPLYERYTSTDTLPSKTHQGSLQGFRISAGALLFLGV